MTEISPAVFHLHRLVPQRLAGGSIEQPPLTTPRRSLCGTDVMGTHAPSPIPLAVNSVNICVADKLLTELTKAESNSLHPIDVINIAVGLSVLHCLTCLQVCEFANLQNNRFAD